MEEGAERADIASILTSDRSRWSFLTPAALEEYSCEGIGGGSRGLQNSIRSSQQHKGHFLMNVSILSLVLSF